MPMYELYPPMHLSIVNSTTLSARFSDGCRIEWTANPEDDEVSVRALAKEHYEWHLTVEIEPSEEFL